MASLAEVDAHRTEVAAVVALAVEDVNAALADVETAREARQILDNILPSLAAEHGDMAASVAADWYEDIREASGARGSFRVDVPDPPDPGRSYALSGWAASEAVVPEGGIAGPAVALLVAGGLQRIVADQSRQTVIQSTLLDPAAVGWQRVGSPDCDLCRILIGRGAVYKQATARFATHDRCGCAAVPAFGGQPLTVDPYSPTARRMSQRTRDRNNQRARDWIADNLTSP